MFKSCFYNFLRNLKYVFVELGFMYLALLLGFDLFFKQLGIGFSQLSEAFQAMIENKDPALIEECFDKIAESVLSVVAGFVTIQIVGLILGFILIMLFIRTDIEKKNILKVLLSAVVDSVILVVFILIIGGISSIASWGGIVVLLLFLALYSLATLFGSYINHGLKTVNFRHAVSFRNMFKLSIYNFLIILATIALGLLCLVIFNAIVGITMLIALFMVGISTISLNADSFVNALVANAKVDKKIESAKESVRQEFAIVEDETSKEEKAEAKEKAKKGE